ncbi:odorant receptor 22c-like isoform X2 [Temnothorax curvispinosus]|uniref:Odorant receptor 22c-like isoform X2 n=1 Tax=Temnothorax curvispinosus TaxID=300111 RepID=A0A6J1RFZ4_9HYME|nr:odorant receptor 22c-like isoform X2 [Temnothorax curvispinosus]
MKVENAVSQAIEICLRIFGIWPNISCVLLRRLFWIVTLVLQQAFQYRYIIMHFHLFEFDEMTKILSAALAYTILLAKLVIFWYKQRKFNTILTMMAADWGERSNTKFSMSVMTCNAKLSRRFANITLCGYIVGILNVLLINLILHISGQIDILRKSVTEIFPKEGKCSPSRSVVKEIIKKHQKVIIFSEHIEDLYSYIALVVFVSDTLMICFLGFTIVASIGQPNASEIIINNLVFYLVMNIEAFVFCFAGEYLSAKSKSIGDDAYDSLWYKSNSRDSRIILLLIMRSQNQLTITIGKIMNLSLEQFSSIQKASASYMSVLFAMY